MAFIRPYTPSDQDASIHIFRETAAPDLRANPDPDVLHFGSFMWCRPYITMYPDWCFVLDDGNGTAVGYILCAPDTPIYVERFKSEFFPVVVQHGISKPETIPVQCQGKTKAEEFQAMIFTPDDCLHSDFPNLVVTYPAHLHIDILSSHQGQGWGEKMIATLVEKLREEGIRGLHLGMVAENHRAGKFYKRLGFQAFQEMNDKGEPGRKGDGIYLVKKL